MEAAALACMQTCDRTGGNYDIGNNSFSTFYSGIAGLTHIFSGVVPCTDYIHTTNVLVIIAFYTA
jgi:hypothetical protein